jgi:uncharacterized protein YkwD
VPDGTSDLVLLRRSFSKDDKRTVSLAPIGFAVLAGFGFFDILPAAHPAVRDAEQLVRIDVSQSVVERRADAAAMLADINVRRASRGLAPLVQDDRLSELARSHAEDMAQRAYFGHTTPEGLTPFERMDQANYRYTYAGENLALDESESAASVALWRSTEHRQNILQPHFGRVGVAAVAVADGEIFVEDFSD